MRVAYREEPKDWLAPCLLLVQSLIAHGNEPGQRGSWGLAVVVEGEEGQIPL